MSLSNSFYDYARLSKLKGERLGYKGPYILTGSGDTTVGLIDAVVVYPESLTGMDVPGKSGGPVIDLDNALSIAGTPSQAGIPVVMDATVTAPDHAVTVAGETLIDYENLRPSDQGETATITGELFGPSTPVTTTPIVGTIEYWSGVAWVALTQTRRWDMVDIISYTITLPSTITGQTKIRCTFGALAQVGDYRWQFTMSVGGVKRFTAYDDFELS